MRSTNKRGRVSPPAPSRMHPPPYNSKPVRGDRGASVSQRSEETRLKTRNPKPNVPCPRKRGVILAPLTSGCRSAVIFSAPSLSRVPALSRDLHFDPTVGETAETRFFFSCTLTQQYRSHRLPHCYDSCLWSAQACFHALLPASNFEMFFCRILQWNSESPSQIASWQKTTSTIRKRRLSSPTSGHNIYT